MSFTNYIFQEAYKELPQNSDRLAEIEEKINWQAFVPIFCNLYRDGPKGGRPHTNEILLAKILVLQGMYGLSDEQLEFQCKDRISFRHFLGLPQVIPDFSTVWYARDRLATNGSENLIWKELQRQLDAMGFSVQKGVIQDATIQEAKRPTGESQKKGRDRDGKYTVKANETYYGYKLHAKTCVDYHLIREIATTPANTHDSVINLISPTDVAAFRDKGYAGTPLPAGVKDGTMKKGYRNKPLSIEDKRQNFALSKIRSPGERPFHVIKNCFHNILHAVTTSFRVHVKNVFMAFGYNLFQMVTLDRYNIARAIKM
jgi:transposase, IS5 family